MRNLFIFVADALRYDCIPRSIKKEGTLLKTLASSLHTPTSFASLLTGRSPEHHNVRGFFDVLNPQIETLFDLFEQGSYYDYPKDPMVKNVLQHCPDPKELSTLSSPFLYVERAMETHVPYGKITHGNDVQTLKKKGIPLGKDYVNGLKKGNIPISAYLKGVKRVEEHFWTHIRELKERNLLDDTLVVFTSDHGELLGERILLKRWYTHSLPMCKKLVLVPTVFLNTEIDPEFMRTIDIAPTSLALLGKESLSISDGVNVTKQKPSRGTTIMEGSAKERFTYRYEVKWKYERGEWIPENKVGLILQNLNMLLLNELSTLPNKRIANSLKDLQSKAFNFFMRSH